MRMLDADALIALISKRLKNELIIGWLCRLIGELPTIEAEPVKHGRWIVKNGRIVCDQCEALWAVCPNKDVQEEEMKMVYKTEKFCYNCGAKMDGGAENGDQ